MRGWGEGGPQGGRKAEVHPMGQARGRLPRAWWRVGIVDVGVAEEAVGKGKREGQ